MTQEASPRRPFVAALLSLVLPGLGQLYNGMPGRAAIFYAVNLAGYLTLMALTSSAALRSGTTFMLAAGLLVLGVCFYLFAILDAYAGARRIGELELRRYNRWYVYLLLAAVSTGLNLAVDFSSAYTRSYRLAASSMAPTLLAGDRVAVAANAYDSGEPTRGDIVVFDLTDGSGARYIKRLVGLPGDRIQVSDGILHINGAQSERRPLPQQPSGEPSGAFALPATLYVETFPDGRPHRIQEISDASRSDNTRVFEIPPDHYFMLGDNRDNSTDSRFPRVGFIPRDSLRGRVLYIWWAQDLSRIGPLNE